MIQNGKKFTDAELLTEVEELDPADVTTDTFRWSSAIDITYRSRFGGPGLKTVRAQGATEKLSDRDSTPEGAVSFWHDSKKYGYHPESQTLYSLEGDTPRRVSTDGGIVRIEQVSFRQRVPIDGAVQEDVAADVYYWSTRAGTLKSVTVEVSRVEENTKNPWRISGKDASDPDRRIEAEVRDEREITSKQWASNEITLGRVARVEFPKGHRYTVDIELPDDKARKVVEKIESRLTKRRGFTNVEVSHDGRIPRE